MLTPIIALIGRPNVGKSTLFNKLTRSVQALVVDLPKTTRDRQYGYGAIGSKPFIVIDTAGIDADTQTEQVDLLATEQVDKAIVEANVIFFVVDAQSGVTHNDFNLVDKLRKLKKSVFLIVNKIDGVNQDFAVAEFYELGLGDPVAISAKQNRGLQQLISLALKDYPEAMLENVEDIDATANSEPNPINIAIVGKPNVGKSTLLNKILGQERVVVCDLPGTTRDSVLVPFTYKQVAYNLIDTAGVRKRGRINSPVEKISVTSTLKAIAIANVVVMMLDSSTGVTDQDLNLLEFIISSGKALIIINNKWDCLLPQARQDYVDRFNYRVAFANFAKHFFISALKKPNIAQLFAAINTAYECATKKISTNELTKHLEQAVALHVPPLINGRRIKLRYAHLGGLNPHRVIIHGNQVDKITDSYKKYLSNYFLRALAIEGSPVFVEFKSGENPYAGKKNILTPRQLKKRKRLKKYVQSKKK